MSSRSDSMSAFRGSSAVMDASTGCDHLDGVSGVADPEQVALDLVRGGVLERGEELPFLFHQPGRSRAQLAGAGQGADLERAVPAREGPRVVVAAGEADDPSDSVEAHCGIGARD